MGSVLLFPLDTHLVNIWRACDAHIDEGCFSIRIMVNYIVLFFRVDFLLFALE
jgi:hypothetical protein